MAKIKKTKAERKENRQARQAAQAQAGLKAKINTNRQKIQEAKAAGNSTYDLKRSLTAKQIRNNQNKLENATSAGNTERASKIENRLNNLKTKRDDRREKSFNSQSPDTAADFDFAKHGSKKVGTRELGHLRREKGFSREDVAAAAQNSGLEIGDKAQKRLDKWASAKDRVNGTKLPAPTPAPTPTPPKFDQPITRMPVPNPTPTPTPPKFDQPITRMPVPQPSPTPTPTPTPFNSQVEDSFNNENEQKVDSSQELNVNNDNDINTAIKGNGNNLTFDVDNSVRNYGSDTRTFNYQSSGNPGLDSPVSAATMGGFYAPSDSHGANAARLDRRITQATDYAKDNMNTSHIAQNAIDAAKRNSTIDPAAMDERVQGRGAASKAQAHLMGNSIYGDLPSFNPQWVQPNTPKPFEMPTFN